jgi:hypothetical protein
MGIETETSNLQINSPRSARRISLFDAMVLSVGLMVVNMGEGEGPEAATPKCQDRLPAWARLDAWGTPKNGIVGRQR